MISTKVTEGQLKEIKEPNVYVSTGTKECYEVITDQQNGCYKQHISYKHEIPWEADYNLVQSADNKQAWGECASLCEGNSRCTFWTWASTSCSNCTRNRCHLLEGDGEPETVNQLGHISGSKQCQDIGYPRFTVLPDASKVKSALADTDFRELPFPPGKCHTQCPVQEVPGFR